MGDAHGGEDAGDEVEGEDDDDEDLGESITMGGAD